MKANKARDVRGPPFANDDDFEEVKGNYQKFLRKWGRFGLSKACDECGTLTPGRYCLQSRRTKKTAWKNCREKKTKYTLPALSPIPAALAALNALERRLLAMAKVNQVLIDKLPAGGPSAQWGRMDMSPLDAPRLCNLLEGAELGQDGEVYVEGVQGMLASTARLQHLFAALQTLQMQHAAYKNSPVVDKALADIARILEQASTAQRQDPASDEAPGENPEEEKLEVTYLLPRDPTIPKADRGELQDLRAKAKRDIDNIDAVLFPHLFPDGQGGYRPHVYYKFSEYARKRLLSRDGRFEADPAYVM